MLLWTKLPEDEFAVSLVGFGASGSEPDLKIVAIFNMSCFPCGDGAEISSTSRLVVRNDRGGIRFGSVSPLKFRPEML